MEEEYQFSKFHILLHKTAKEIEKTRIKEIYKHKRQQTKLVLVICVGFESINNQKEKDCNVKKTFRTEIYRNNELEEAVYDAVENVFRDIEVYKGVGSPWTIKRLYSVDINMKELLEDENE